jgi:hypothetical protein
MNTSVSLVDRRIRNTLLAGIAGWFVLILGIAIVGGFDRPGRGPLPIGIAALTPIVLFAFAYNASSRVRQSLLRLDRRLLALAQAWRVLGIVFVLLYLRGLLPASFALPAGLGDLFIGITAPLAARVAYATISRDRRLFIAWNLLGLLDLVAAVVLGILNSAGPLGILAGSVSTGIMGTFPLTMIPTFFVPLLTILHLIVLAQLRQKNQ